MKLGFDKSARCAPFALLVCLLVALLGNCQVIDDLTEQGRSALRKVGYTPQMFAILQEKAEKGEAKGEFALGWVYFIGEGVEKNDALALEWMTKAAEQGLAVAQDTIGPMYLLAKDLPNNYKLAKMWLQKGADRNEADAWNGLGVIYSQGLGEEVNAQEAIPCFRKASDLGSEKADSNYKPRTNFLDVLSAKMTPDQIADAQRQAASWFQEHESKTLSAPNSSTQ